MNMAKLIADRAELPQEVCGQTINRFCSSSLQAIATAANAISGGDSITFAATQCVELLSELTTPHEMPSQLRMKI